MAGRCNNHSEDHTDPYWVKTYGYTNILIIINIFNNVNYCKDHRCPDSSDER